METLKNFFVENATPNTSKVSEWISVEDRLPGDGDIVISHYVGVELPELINGQPVMSQGPTLPGIRQKEQVIPSFTGLERAMGTVCQGPHSDTRLSVTWPSTTANSSIRRCRYSRIRPGRPIAAALRRSSAQSSSVGLTQRSCTVSPMVPLRFDLLQLHQQLGVAWRMFDGQQDNYLHVI